jgi:hypothetical protein
MQELTPEAPEAAEGAPEPMAEVVEKATEGEAVTTSPEIALEVAIRSPEIQDAEPIRSAPMLPRVAVAVLCSTLILVRLLCTGTQVEIGTPSGAVRPAGSHVTSSPKGKGGCLEFFSTPNSNSSISSSE